MTKVLWTWSEEWTTKDVASVWLPMLFLSRVAGKTTLYLGGQWNEWGSPRRSTLVRELLEIIWRVARADEAIVDTAERGVDVAAESLSYPTLEALGEALEGLWGADRNYIVRLSRFTLAEQDGDMVVIEAPREDLQLLFDAIAEHADQAGWTFVDAVDDWPDEDK